MSLRKKILPSLALIGALPFLTPAIAWGQAATDLVCAGCVQATDIANGTIGPNKLIPGSVNATTIANQSIGPNKLIPGSINETTIATDAIRGNKVLDGSLTGNDLADGTITGDDIRNGSITTFDYAVNSVGRAALAGNSVGLSEIITGGVSGEEVLNGSLTAVDLRDEAGAEFIDGEQFIGLTVADTVVRSIRISRPAGGVVIVNASGTWSWGSIGRDGARCSISTGASLDTTHLMQGSDSGSTAAFNDFMPFAGTRALVFTSSGSSTFNLVCDVFEGEVTVSDSGINAIYVPTRY